MNNLSLDLLRTFVVFVESRSVQDAAHKLGLTQPAVSLQLKRLDGLVPYPLFSVEGNRKVPSSYGRALYHALREKLFEVHTSVARVTGQFGDPSLCELRVGARKELFLRVMELLPFAGKLHLVDLTAADATQALLRHEIDLAISWDKPNSSNIIARHLFSNSTQICVARSHLKGRSWNAQLATDPDFLLSTPCIAYKDDAPFLSAWAEHCGADCRLLRIKCVCPDWGAVVRMVEAGQGYAIAPTEFPVASEVHTFPIPIDVIPEISYYALYHKDLRGLPALRSLLAGNQNRTTTPL